MGWMRGLVGLLLMLFVIGGVAFVAYQVGADGGGKEQVATVRWWS